jgi:hypothetical protein
MTLASSALSRVLGWSQSIKSQIQDLLPFEEPCIQDKHTAAWSLAANILDTGLPWLPHCSMNQQKEQQQKEQQQQQDRADGSDLGGEEEILVMMSQKVRSGCASVEVDGFHRSGMKGDYAAVSRQ